MAVRKVNIIGERAWHTFLDRPAEEVEQLLRTHLGLTGVGPHDIIVFGIPTIEKLNTVLTSKNLPIVNIIEEETTIAQYKLMNKKNPVNPQRLGSMWVCSQTDWKYDTPSGKLEEGCYAIEETGRVLVKKLGGKQMNKANLEEALSDLI